jgi:hypothetical protein
MVGMLRGAALSGYGVLSDELGLDARRLLDAVGLPRLAVPVLLEPQIQAAAKA